MFSTLDANPVAATLDRLLAAESEQDVAAFAAAGFTSPSEFPSDSSPFELAERTKDVYMSVSRETGELLYALTRATGAASVVEFGTSFGISTIYLASAVRDNGGGQVITTEIQQDKARRARENLDEAGVGDLVDLRLGDARETLRELPDTVDLLLLDGFPTFRREILRLVEPRLRSGALVLVDDIDLEFGRDTKWRFLAYVDDRANGYHSLRLPIGDGLQMCTRLG